MLNRSQFKQDRFRKKYHAFILLRLEHIPDNYFQGRKNIMTINKIKIIMYIFAHTQQVVVKNVITNIFF